MTAKDYTLRPLRPADFPAALALWKAAKGVGVREDDTAANFRRFLKRNPGFSFGAFVAARLVGTVLCGHDGRRGNLVHLAVAEDHRGRGMGRSLVEKSLARLEKAGIPRTHVMVFKTNRAGRAFWKALGWNERTDLSFFTSGPVAQCRKGC